MTSVNIAGVLENVLGTVWSHCSLVPLDFGISLMAQDHLTWLWKKPSFLWYHQIRVGRDEAHAPTPTHFSE